MRARRAELEGRGGWEADDLFTAKDRWDGGHYELELELGLRSDERLLAALDALWSHPALEGPVADSSREPEEQPRARLEDGAVGWEVEFLLEDRGRWLRDGVQAERYDGVLWPRDGVLEWHPSTQARRIDWWR